ncbi:FecCD transport family protein [Bacillus sp. OK838]|nr:FecCD transport family protein [Bacillus sp. OK838]
MQIGCQGTYGVQTGLSFWPSFHGLRLQQLSLLQEASPSSGSGLPHFARALVGFLNQLFQPVAILIRAWLLLLADTIGRNILEPKGIPAGIMIALIEK